MKLFQFSISIKIPSKKNSYIIHFNPRFWKAVSSVIGYFPKRYWIAPGEMVKEAEQIIAWTAKAKLRAPLEGKIVLLAEVNPRLDVDNALAVILDGLQKSGRIANDRQIEIAVAIRGESKDKCHVTLIQVDSDEKPLHCLAEVLKHLTVYEDQREKAGYFGGKGLF